MMHEYGYWAGLAAVIIAAVAIWRWTAKKPKPAQEPPEPIQKYDRFPEPMKTIETRDGKDIPF